MCWNKRNIPMKRINKIMRNKQTLKNKIKNKLALCIKKEGYDWFQWGGGGGLDSQLRVATQDICLMWSMWAEKKVLGQKMTLRFLTITNNY